MHRKKSNKIIYIKFRYQIHLSLNGYDVSDFTDYCTGIAIQRVLKISPWDMLVFLRSELLISSSPLWCI